jgi:hypothetical protein
MSTNTKRQEVIVRLCLNENTIQKTGSNMWPLVERMTQSLTSPQNNENTVAGPRRRLWMRREEAMDAAGTMKAILQEAKAEEVSFCDGDGQRGQI